jgi:ATP-dependent exoDNAse (exonuclease V) beta subunit
MPSVQIQPFKILNASAGSGKTYNLVKEYILLLIHDEKDYTRFSRIIAMTFTNKAALEMKTRIIKALDLLSYPDIYKEKSSDYAIELGQELGINPEEVHVRAQRVLLNILHRYEDFFVMTIDKFNLKLIRSFSRDLDLPNDFEVILNETEVIEQVVDLLLNELGKETIKELTRTVFEYAKNNLDEGEKWNFKDQLVDFGKILTKERDQSQIEKLLKMDFSIDRHKELRAKLKSELAVFIDECKSVYRLYESLGLVIGELPGASRTSGAIEKLASITDIPSKDLFSPSFLTSASTDPPKGKIFPAELQTALIRLNEKYLLIKPLYFIQKLFLKNYYNMAMLQFMAKSLDAVKKDEQLIRISEFNKLISDLVRSEEAPFIYERLGTRFQHFLLDEFQDTSRLQWLNMVPLVHESISNLNKNLIVGDPKQSIYRFKNGVAEQFVALPKIYNPENEPNISQKSMYFDQMGHVRSLDDNWRSSPVIVNFNNSFFPFLKEKLSDGAKDFYNSIHQNAKSDLPGLVEIVSQPTEESVDLVPLIIEKIKQCEEDGFKRGEICILSDVNTRANQWAIELTKKGYKVVSAESLLVQNEVKVKLVLSYLKRRLNPSSLSEQKRFSELFFRINKENAFENYRKYFEKSIGKDGKEYTLFNDEKFITDQFGGRNDFYCKFENLYDLIQSFYRLMKWEELKNPYLHHFADFAHEFELAKGPDVKSFLSYYAEQKSKLAIQLPESDDAIKIMTIHKSKGLEFPVVILPFIDLGLELKNNAKFLIEIEDIVLYTTLSKESPVAEIIDYQSAEKSQILTDKVNLCYVAFTRPMERLYILNHHKKTSFGALAHECFKQLPHVEIAEDDSISLQLGSRTRHTTTQLEKSSSFFEPQTITDNLWFPDISLQDRSVLKDINFLSAEQRFGTQFHLAMATINDASSIDATIHQLCKEGEIETEFAEDITTKIAGIFKLPAFTSLFENAKEILNEQSIILDEQNLRRPDKLILKDSETIVLDYKTGVPSKKDEKQMQEYIATIQKMDLPSVKGYIFYTYNNELRPFN